MKCSMQSNTEYVEKCIDNMMKVIKTDFNLIEYVTYFHGQNGFLWDTDLRKQQIYNAVENDGHSGASFALCLRECQRRLKNN